jgi:hypothetical protein
MFSQTAPGLPTFEAYGCFEVAFHLELSPNERGRRGVDIRGQQRLESFVGGNAEGKLGNSIPGPKLGSITEKDAPNRSVERAWSIGRSGSHTSGRMTKTTLPSSNRTAE